MTRCEHCGSPVDANELAAGSCKSCGAVLPHVVRAAEKAEVVRRVAAQGLGVRIGDDGVEVRPPVAATPPAGPPVVRDRNANAHHAAAGAVAAGIAGLLGVGVAVWAVIATPGRISRRGPTVRPASIPAEVVPSAPIDVSPSRPPASAAASASAAPGAGRRATTPRGAAAPVGSPHQNVVNAHVARFSSCHRDELAVDPQAPRRYTLAITVQPDGTASDVGLLSVGSSAMEACLRRVMRQLQFPAGQAGTVTVTLSLGA